MRRRGGIQFVMVGEVAKAGQTVNTALNMQKIALFERTKHLNVFLLNIILLI